MTSQSEDYDWEEILERLDVSFGDFGTMSELINRLDEALGRPASALQIDRSVQILQTQRQLAANLGYTVSRFERQGRVVTQLRDARGRFVAATDIIIGETRTTTRRFVGSIARALARGAG